MQWVLAYTQASVFVVLCTIVAAHSAVANEPALKKPNPHFARLDANKDGFLSYAEARVDKEAAQHFALFDENRDGRLSEDEFLKLKAAQARHRGGAYISDGLITSKVRLAVLRAKDLKATDVHVETVAAVVRLSGEVENAKQSARVAQLAGRVQGVRKVENNLTIRPGHQ
jgi:osmotically-inducible protein OsmY